MGVKMIWCKDNPLLSNEWYWYRNLKLKVKPIPVLTVKAKGKVFAIGFKINGQMFNFGADGDEFSHRPISKPNECGKTQNAEGLQV